MDNYKNPIAEINRPDSGIIIRPEDAYKIKEKNHFYCPDKNCLDKERILIVSKSKYDNFFFKHRANFNHDINPETLLHKLAKNWFVQKESIEIPKYNYPEGRLKQQTVILNPSKTEIEYRGLNNIVPDVRLVASKGFEFLIEIVVTHDIDFNGNSIVERMKFPTIRIDLEKFYNHNKDQCHYNYEFVVNNVDALLKYMNNLSWVCPPEYNLTNEKLAFEEKGKDDLIGCVFSILTVGLILFIKKFLKNIKTKKIPISYELSKFI